MVRSSGLSSHAARRLAVGVCVSGTLIAAGAIILGCAASAPPPPDNATTTQPPTTLKVVNTSGSDVTVYLTLGAETGNWITDVSKIPFITGGSGLQGTFVLAANGGSVSYAPPQGYGMSGNFSFGSPPLNCATSQFPSGINLGEFTIDPPGAGMQETIDISGVTGTNALLEFSMSGGGAWNAGPGGNNITSFFNNSIGQQIGQIGVFPYTMTNCTNNAGYPVCFQTPVGAQNPPQPQPQPFCNVQRTQFGGTVTLTYKGPA